MKPIKTLTATAALLLLAGCGTATTDSRNACTMQGGQLVADSHTAIATTRQGQVAGYLDNGVYTYKGIPYAKAQRFMPPVEPDSWEGIRSSRAYGPTAPQGKRMGWYSDEQAFAFHWDDGFPGEDCLRVNVWTPASKADGRKRPVMVWLHGGGYSAGSGQELPSYDGANLARKGDVVVVSLNHRLNVLGFLDLSAYGDQYARSGNVGLLDLIAALQWVNKNIANFGGDADNVTIFGQSGGGGKVSTLLATPAARGLFHKAIVQSGSMLRTMEARWSRRIGTAVVEELGLKPSQIDQLRTMPYERLLAAGEKAVARVKAEAEKEGISSFIFGWAPTVDGDVLPAQPFDPEAPRQSKEIPMLIGTTMHEFTTTAYVPALRGASPQQAREFLARKYGDRTDEFIRLFQAAYPGCQPMDMIDADFIFRPGAVEQARLKARQGGAPVYMYLFTWESPVMDGMFRSTHCMEIPFVFNNVVRHASMTGGGAEAVALGELMSSAWLHFARTGDPNVEGLPEWEPYTAEGGATLFFGNRCELRRHHDRDLLNFVHSFPLRGF